MNDVIAELNKVIPSHPTTITIDCAICYGTGRLRNPVEIFGSADGWDRLSGGVYVCKSCSGLGTIVAPAPTIRVR